MSGFTIAKDLSIQGMMPENWLYYINHRPNKRANARFGIKEGPQGRKVLAFAKRNIKPGEEIFVDYGNQWEAPTSEKMNAISNEKDYYDEGEYVLVRGHDEGRPEEIWVAIVKKRWLDGSNKYTVAYLYHPTHLILPAQHSYEFGVWELLMCKQTEQIEAENIMTRTTVAKGLDFTEDQSATWWWNRWYNRHTLHISNRKETVEPSKVKNHRGNDKKSLREPQAIEDARKSSYEGPRLRSNAREQMQENFSEVAITPNVYQVRHLFITEL
ncbi:hypothetical protein N0V90_004003 [Kalmusia sp. IMI 367209]|nr:hypothetical protein N0V90_004003 [Kalmusia sp. IMI 367209]